MFACFHCSGHRRGRSCLSSSCFAYESHKRTVCRRWISVRLNDCRVSAFLPLSPHPCTSTMSAALLRPPHWHRHQLASPPCPARSSNLVASPRWIPTTVPRLQQPSRTVSRETCRRGEAGGRQERCQLLICSGRRHKYPNNAVYRSMRLRKTCNLALPPLKCYGHTHIYT